MISSNVEPNRKISLHKILICQVELLVQLKLLKQQNLKRSSCLIFLGHGTMEVKTC